MLLTKIIALAAFISWLGMTGQHLYDYLGSGEPAAEQAKVDPLPGGVHWSFDLLRR